MIKKRYTVILFWLIILALLVMFFTNDFGLVDLSKTSVVVAVGVDVEDEEVLVTAQVAVPQPSQSGDNVKYVQVQGRGLTVADCLNEINSKTGFYPKLLFCKLILIGEECKDKELFRVLGCFYRRNYSELTALVAMCKGKAMEMLAMPATISQENSTAMQRALSEELKKSANVSSVSLKDIAETNYSVSRACYMPFIEANIEGTSEGGGDGDNVGGESGGEGFSGGGGGESGGEGEQGGKKKMEFTARRTAVFSGGKFTGLLDETTSFALNILKNEIRLAVLPCDVGDTHYTVGLKNTDGGVKLKFEDGKPKATLSFEALAQVQGAKKVLEPDSVMFDDVVKPEVLKAAEDAVKERFDKLLELCVKTDSDILGIRTLLHKYNYKYYEDFKDNILSEMQIEYDVKIQSLN